MMRDSLLMLVLMSAKISFNQAQVFYSDEGPELGSPEVVSQPSQEVSIARLKSLIHELDAFLDHLTDTSTLENQLELLRQTQESDSLPFSMNGVRGKKAAFNGMRGKKAAFNGMRGRRAAFVGMRGKRAPFNGMRGKRDLSSSGKKLEVPVSSSDW